MDASSDLKMIDAREDLKEEEEEGNVNVDVR